MSRLAIIPMLLLALGGEHERGLQLYREGKFAEAAAAFRAAIAQDGDSAELQWNLARACFAAGEFEAAEVAAEKYAALAKDARGDLHLGMLGAVRHAQAKTLAAAAETPPAPKAADPQATDPQAADTPADPLPELEKALAKAKDAGDYYERAVAAQPAPELLRNLERVQRLQQALAARIDELKRQREQQQSEDKEKDPQQKDQGDKKPDEKNKDDEKKSDDKKDDDKKDDDKKDDDKKGDDKKQDEKQDKSEQEQKGEPEQKKPGEEPKGEPKPQDGKSEQQQGAGDKSEQPEPQGNGGDQQQPDKEQKGQQPPEAGKDGRDGASSPPVGAKPEDGKGAAGEPKPATELTPEQAQQLMERLQKLDERLRAVRARARSGRPPVERDW